MRQITVPDVRSGSIATFAVPGWRDNYFPDNGQECGR